MSARVVVLGGAGTVGVSTAVVSSVSLFHLAEACSIRSPLAAGLPLAIDAAGVVGAVSWVSQQGAARRWGQGIAVVALVLTIAGNGLSHAISAGLVPVSLWLVLTVGAVIPASLWMTVHLSAVILASGTPRKGGRKSPRPTQSVAPQPARRQNATPRRDGSERAPSPETAPPQTPAVLTSIETASKLSDRVAFWLLSHPDATTAEVRARFECGEATVKRARARYRELMAARAVSNGAGR